MATKIYGLAGIDGFLYYTTLSESKKEAKYVADKTDEEVEVYKFTVAKMRPADLAVALLQGGWCDGSTVVYRATPRKKK